MAPPAFLPPFSLPLHPSPHRHQQLFSPLSPHRRHQQLISPRRPRPTMSAGDSGELRRRMASVQTAEKLIDAMRLVAAARIRASTVAALAARPFAERLQGTLASLVNNILDAGTDVEGVAAGARGDAFGVLGGRGIAIDNAAQKALMDRMGLALMEGAGDVGDTTLIVVVTGDRGFCGGFNKEVLARAVRRMEAVWASGEGRDVELVLVGKKAIRFFKRRYPGVAVRFSTECGRPGEVGKNAAVVCDAVLSQFIAGELERVEVIYTRFTSLVSSTPSVRTLLPVTPTGLEVADDEIFQLTSRNGRLFVDKSPAVAVATSLEGRWRDVKAPDYKMSEEGSILLLNAMLPMYVHSQMVRILRDSTAAELSCRMNAMNAATDNCKDISKSLKGRYNKERQERITAEVIMVSCARE